VLAFDGWSVLSEYTSSLFCIFLLYSYVDLRDVEEAKYQSEFLEET